VASSGKALWNGKYVVVEGQNEKPCPNKEYLSEEVNAQEHLQLNFSSVTGYSIDLSRVKTPKNKRKGKVKCNFPSSIFFF
jgi:hypothetical protein